ncbi:unnamed protein product, partial [Discosporangium mesarthrocarpum]
RFVSGWERAPDMGSYAQTFEIPKEFPEILREFAKEAIRHQPSDIYRFGYEYFQNLSSRKVKEIFMDSSANSNIPRDTVADTTQGFAAINASDEMGLIALGDVHEVKEEDASDGADPKEAEQLQDRMSVLFSQADADGNGRLSRKEFVEVFELLGEELGLTKNDVLKILAEADSNDDGIIDYKEFMPVASEVVQAIMAKEKYAEERITRKRRSSTKDEVREYLMKGLPRAELEESIQQIFRGHDNDGNGTLDREEFVRCIKESGLGFTRREVNLVLTLIDKNSDGVIDYEEFMPICLSMIVEVLSDKMQEVPQEEQAMAHHIAKLLTEAKQRCGGRLTAGDASDCLNRADLGLRFVQVCAIMSEVEESAEGEVEVESVATAAAGMTMALNSLHLSQ